MAKWGAPGGLPFPSTFEIRHSLCSYSSVVYRWGLLVAQRLDRVHIRGLPGGIDAERVGTLSTYVDRIVQREAGDPLP